MDSNPVKFSLICAVCLLMAACADVKEPSEVSAPPMAGAPSPGRKLVTAPEIAWQSANCGSRPLPYLRVDHSDVVPQVIKRGGAIIHRFAYVACVPAQPGYILGQFRTTVIFNGKELNTRIDKTFPVDSGGWIVDTEIAVPPQAEPGLYVVEASLLAKDASVQDRINFTVQP